MMDEKQRKLLEDFNRAFNEHDVSGMMRLMTGDCIFENTFPAPDGTRYTGAQAVLKFWESFFAANPESSIEIVEMFGSGERLCQRWIYRWGGQNPGHVSGVDVFHLRGDRILKKFSYVKG